MANTAPIDDAFAFLEYMLKEWGLESLSGMMKNLLIDGVPKEVVPIKLRETQEYKTRFKALIERQKKGLPPMSEAELLATEGALKTVVRRFVGEGAYDTREYTDKWIANDLAPQELADRMNTWAEKFDSKPEEYKQWWYRHGLTRADAIKAVMDPSVTETTIKRRMGGLAVGAEAFRAYGAEKFTAADQGRFEQYSEAGVSEGQAREGFGKVAARQDRDSFLANLAGEKLTKEEQESEELLGDAQAAAKRRKIYEQEQGRFEQNYQGGIRAFEKEKSGSY